MGSSLAIGLSEAGHSVAIMDRKPEAFIRLPPDFAGLTVAGVGFDRDRLTEAGIERALRDLGVDEPRSARLVDALVRAAFGTGAGVWLVPASGGPTEGVGAILRW